MSKRKRRVHDGRIDVTRRAASGVPGSAESHLLPGSAQREAMLKRQQEKQAEKQAQDEAKKTAEVQAVKVEPKVEQAYQQPAITALRKYINFIRKYSLVQKTRSIIEKGLGRKVGRKDLDDELHDPTISEKTFIREAVADHKGELMAQMSEPVSDTNGDHMVDAEDEPEVTPGMSRMANYL